MIHCWHTDEFPGTWRCCQCTTRADGYPGRCRGDYDKLPCFVKRWHKFRHRWWGL